MAWAGAGELAPTFPRRPCGRAATRARRRAAATLAIGRALRRTIRERGVDLVHAHLSAAEFVAAFATPAGVPIVASRRGRTLNHEDRIWFRTGRA